MNFSLDKKLRKERKPLYSIAKTEKSESSRIHVIVNVYTSAEIARNNITRFLRAIARLDLPLNAVVRVSESTSGSDWLLIAHERDEIRVCTGILPSLIEPFEARR